MTQDRLPQVGGSQVGGIISRQLKDSAMWDVHLVGRQPAGEALWYMMLSLVSNTFSALNHSFQRGCRQQSDKEGISSGGNYV